MEVYGICALSVAMLSKVSDMSDTLSSILIAIILCLAVIYFILCVMNEIKRGAKPTDAMKKSLEKTIIAVKTIKDMKADLEDDGQINGSTNKTDEQKDDNKEE